MKEIVKIIDNSLGRSSLTAKDATMIESFLLKAYPDAEWASDAADVLAQYRPGGGEHLYDYQHVVVILRHIKERMQNSII